MKTFLLIIIFILVLSSWGFIFDITGYIIKKLYHLIRGTAKLEQSSDFQQNTSNPFNL